ncbi:HAD family hydrolase [Amycolatopsis sp. WQ 127309]|uniref:HAD family hydrolase n=1 Tax=Amycolatopsis sp. WQ 127309 TaxID=2932773 RepID=UPI001FF49849|nr:HAD family hydrolase [Amycolatopsis sp. WQ 127309]UOZ05673.1 HAD family hydrolase [Amycolatopsis sp. WQ 127309]
MSPREPVETVLLDAGGVLIMPAAEAVITVLRAAGVRADVDVIDRAHYAATAANDASPPRNRLLYLKAFARACGVKDERVEWVAAELSIAIDGPTWTRELRGAANSLRALSSLPVVLGVVSNSVGLVAEQLRQAGICQVGPGAGIPVALVIDSALVGIAKPDPGIFHLALRELDARPGRTVYVGDTARIDVDGALAAGIRPLHLDPHLDCPDPPGRHEHLRSLGDLAAWVHAHGR